MSYFSPPFIKSFIFQRSFFIRFQQGISFHPPFDKSHFSSALWQVLIISPSKDPFFLSTLWPDLLFIRLLTGLIFHPPFDESFIFQRYYFHPLFSRVSVFIRPLTSFIFICLLTGLNFLSILPKIRFFILALIRIIVHPTFNGSTFSSALW